MTITTERMEKAITYLAETDQTCADLRADMERAEFKAKAIRDALFMRLTGTVAERTAQAGAMAEYHEAMNRYFGFVSAYESVKNKRSTEAIVCECWRSVNSNRKQGIVA